MFVDYDIMHLQKMITNFYKDYPEKFTALFPHLDSATPFARPMVKLKQKHGKDKPTKSTKKTKKA